MDRFRLFSRAPRSIVRDAFVLALADGSTVEVARVRDPRARRVRLTVDDRGARLTLPPRTSLVAGERFAVEHRDWLAAQLARHALRECPRVQPFVTAALPLRDAAVPLSWVEGRYASVQFDPEDESSLLFTLPARAGEASAVRALRAFYEAQARADVGRWLPRYLGGLPRAPRRFRFRPMRSQWGSLAPDATVALDLSLVLAPPAAFEYVLVHELCHLIHADHSRRFWGEVEARCPDWRGQRDWFRSHGHAVKATLGGLMALPD